jgi:hypothetical protein
MRDLGILTLGLVAGVASGMFGIGGGVIIVPALLVIFGIKELEAIGTSLGALLLPVGILGAMEHYKAGNITIKYSALLAAGLFVGAYFGAKIVIGLPPLTVRRVYAGFLLLLSCRMLIYGK